MWSLLFGKKRPLLNQSSHRTRSIALFLEQDRSGKLLLRQIDSVQLRHLRHKLGQVVAKNLDFQSARVRLTAALLVNCGVPLGAAVPLGRSVAQDRILANQRPAIARAGRRSCE